MQSICKPPEERHNTAGMSEESLEIIQPTPPHFTGEERGKLGRDLLKVTQTPGH
jgi:hypothetical protein